MRSVIAACALLVLGTAAAEAQPYYGFGGPPAYGYGHGYGYDHGYGWRRPHPPGWGWGGPPRYRRCWFVPSYYGPRRVCRGGW